MRGVSPFLGKIIKILRLTDTELQDLHINHLDFGPEVVQLPKLGGLMVKIPCQIKNLSKVGDADERVKRCFALLLQQTKKLAEKQLKSKKAKSFGMYIDW